MVQGIKFLTKKSFNPTNLNNQKQVWEREQQRKQQTLEAEQREKQLQRERDDALIAQSRGEINKVSFLYEQPPGMIQSKPNSMSIGERNNSAVEDASNDTKPPPLTKDSKMEVGGGGGGGFGTHWAERQPGDDDAAAAFRRLLAGQATSNHTSLDHDTNATTAISMTSSSRGTVLQGTSYDPMTDPTKFNGSNSLSALEKAVGKRPQHSQRNSLTLEEQIQRFPALANAPRVAGIGNHPNNTASKGAMESDHNNPSNSVCVTFKPLGAQIRNVRCLVCGIWGHSRGDRECAISGWDPFAAVTNNTTTNDLGVSKLTTASTASTSQLDLKSGSDAHDDELLQSRDGGKEKRSRSKKLKRHKRRRSDSCDDHDRIIQSSGDNCSITTSESSDDEGRRRRRHRKKYKRSRTSQNESSKSKKGKRYDSDDKSSDTESGNDDQYRTRRHKSHNKQRR
jgi:CBF1 interacting corepressor